MEKLKCTFRKICDTIRNIKDNVGFYKRLWDKPQGKAAADNVKQQLIYLLKKSGRAKLKETLFSVPEIRRPRDRRLERSRCCTAFIRKS